MRKVMLLLVVLGLAGALWAADPFVGNWKLNLAKCKADIPTLLPKSETVKIVALDNGFKTTFDGVDSQGKAYRNEWSATYDGKEHPVTGDPDTDMVFMKKIDPNTITVGAKKAGKEVSSWRVSISKDGKTQTAVGKVKDAKGQESNMTEVFDKQ
jgi:hypothetical protein